jgi:hypothetical protein
MPAPAPIPSQPLATPESTRPSTPASVTTYKIVSKPITLPAPTPVNFNVDPVAFKGLPLEAAQWSFTSDQLREMVSRAIRDSAKEQFIRLLSLDSLDKDIPEELARLESLKFTTQAQHRFHFQRRTNLLQSLNALASSIPVSAEHGAGTLGTLIQQLAEITSSMDRFTETLLGASEHRSQLAQVREKHLSSALAMALRKLNASYAKRTNDLKQARARIATLQTELEEAWKVAEGMAEEIDDLDNFQSDYALEERFDDGETEDNIPDDDPTMMSVAHAQVVPVTGTAVVSKATLVGSPPPDGDAKFLAPPQTHVRRPRPPNGPTGDRDRSSIISAAKKRISLISQRAIKIQRSNSESDGGNGLSVPNTPKSSQKNPKSRSEGKDPMTESPSLLSNPSNTSFLELSRPATPLPSDEETIPPVPVSPRAQQADGGVSASTEDVGQIFEDDQGTTSSRFLCCVGRATRPIGIKLTPFPFRLAKLDYSPGFSAAFDSAMIPPPPLDNDLPSPLTRTSSMSIPHLPPTQDTRRIQSMQPSLSVPSPLQSRDQDSEGCDQMGYDDGPQDNPAVPVLRILQEGEEVHVVPLPDAEEDDRRPSTSHHTYDKSDFWPWTTRNTTILASSVSPSIDSKVDRDLVVEIGPSSSASMNLIVDGQDREDRSPSSYLPDMTTPSTGSVNDNDTETTDPPISIIASDDSEDNNDGHESHGGLDSGVGGSESQPPPSPAASDVPEMPVFAPPRNPSQSPERHGTIGSLIARKNSLFRSRSGDNSHDKRSSMPLPSAVIASLLPWRGSMSRHSSEPELPSQTSGGKSRSRLSSSLPSPH